jgi:biofilm PGA synthesis N-glycosyltransferase PgaC
MDRLIRTVLLSGGVLYFACCILGGLEINHALHRFMVILFLAYGVIVIWRYVFLLASAIIDKNRNAHQTPSSWTPAVTIIVPAYNEENLIESSLTSLIRLDYPHYDIIVIDDGSTDNTAKIAREVSERHPEIQINIISQSNAGKSWALNTGIVHAQGELLLCVDSDSRLNPDVLTNAVHYFHNPRVGAIGGFVDIINTDSIIARLQQIEYIIGLNFLRRGLSLFGCVTVVPGPIGLFRKEAILDVGGYSITGDCFAEDADLTVRLLVNGWRVCGDTRMIAKTEAPNKLYSLLRQRYRWKRGLFQAWSNNIFMLISNPSQRRIFTAVILTLESFLFDIANFGITIFALSSFIAFGQLNVFLWAFIILAGLDLCVFIFTHLEQKYIFRHFCLFLLSKISYAYILQAWGVFALFDEMTSTKMQWDKLERIGGNSF